MFNFTTRNMSTKSNKMLNNKQDKCTYIRVIIRPSLRRKYVQLNAKCILKTFHPRKCSKVKICHNKYRS